MTKPMQTRDDKDVMANLLGTSIPAEQTAKVRRLLMGPTTIVVHVNPVNGDVQIVPIGKEGMTPGEMRDVLAGICEMLLKQERKAAGNLLVASKDGGQ